jgi:hypothetical protein
MNPYEAPKFTEQTSKLQRLVASRLLHFRGRGFSYGYFFKLQAKAYVLLVLWSGLGIIYFAWLKMPQLALGLVGVLIGVALRDFGIARAQKKVWPVQQKLLDWDKVERMAAGDPL